MTARFGVRLFGASYVVLGVVGLLPIAAVNPTVADGDGIRLLLGHVAVNGLHDLLHVVIGATALLASRSDRGVRRWGRLWGIVLLALAVVGFAQAAALGLPDVQVLAGLVPLNAAGHMLHLVTGGLILYLGVRREPTPVDVAAG